MRGYLGYLIWWGPILVALGMCGVLYWQFRPHLAGLRVPQPPPIYRELPRVSPERIRYVPVSPVRMAGFEERKETPSSPPLKRAVRVASSYELKAILRVGARRVCKFEDRFLEEGSFLGPFKIIKIGENYVELRGEGKEFKVFVGERLVF